MQLNCQETDLTPATQFTEQFISNVFRAKSPDVLGRSGGKKEQKRERKRHFKYQMTHLMADIISRPDARSAPRLKLLTAAVETLHYSEAASIIRPLVQGVGLI